MENIAKNLLLTVLTTILVLLTTNAVSAGTTLGLDEVTKDVPIGGTVDFTVTLKTSYTGPGVIYWQIANGDPIIARLGSEQMSKVGNILVNTPPATQTFTLTVATQSGAVVGQEYPIELNYCTGTEPCLGNTAIARATAGVIPTPELSTSILTATGLIGLIGLVKFKRKD